AGREEVDDSGDGALVADGGLRTAGLREVEAHQGASATEVDRDAGLGLAGFVGRVEAEREAVDASYPGPGGIRCGVEARRGGWLADRTSHRRARACGRDRLELAERLLGGI